LQLQQDRLDTAARDLATLEQRIQQKLKPYAVQVALLQEIPGVDWTLAAVIIAELGIDMSVFQSVSQLASWAGVCPGNNESAGEPTHLNTILSTSLLSRTIRHPPPLSQTPRLETSLRPLPLVGAPRPVRRITDGRTSNDEEETCAVAQ
jgi:hypothetical protein